MPKILVIGATGYLGSRICATLVRHNHSVYGLARDARKAQGLAGQEITPVVGTVDDAAGYLAVIRDENVDVVIDASGAMDGAYRILADLRAVGEERVRRAREAGVPSQRLGYVYTSGMWVHGDSLDRVTDVDPVGEGARTPPAKIVAWRPKLEQEILKTRDVLDVAILRPAMMYGGLSSIWGLLFGPILAAAGAKEDKATVQADPACITALAHVDDVALAYMKAAEKVHLLAGTGVVPIFDLQTSWENLGIIVNAFARAVGFQGKVETVPTGDNVFAEALSTSLLGDSSRAKQILDWEPKKVDGLAAGMKVYAHAFAAGQGK